MAISDLSLSYNIADIETCSSLQNEELEVLQAIFPECIHSQNSDGILKIEIPIEFGSSRVVKITDVDLSPSWSSSSAARRSEGLSLTVLPPVVLFVSLPPSYPLYAPPDIVSLQATHQWLANTRGIKDALFRIFNSGESVLYNWIEYLRSGDFLVDLNSVSSEDGLAVELYHPSPPILATLLCGFEVSFNSAQFSQSSYPCSICLTHLKGINCVKLQCEHIFCRSCLEDFWSMCIAEGDAGRVGCPDPDCIKEGKESCEDQVSRIVSASQFERWKRLKIKRELERDPTIMHCPRLQCQNLVPKPGDADPESGWDRFRQCDQCFYSFCALCKNTWHGPLSPCPVGYRERLLEEYLATEEGSTARTTLELRYGRLFVFRLVAEHAQEQATSQWISSSTTLCPGCESPVQKSEGCNHMICTRCNKHFCYRCGDLLDSITPYNHFSVEGGQCFEKLFDFEPFHEQGWQ